MDEGAYEYYERTDAGAPPVLLAEMKKALRIRPGDNPDDDFLTSLLFTSADEVERYTARESRANTWVLYVDEFYDRTPIRRVPLDDVTKVEYLVDGAWVEVDSATYYLKKGEQFCELLLVSGKAWPTDLDDVEAGVRITFTTQAHRTLEAMRAAIFRHVTHMYENRGDSGESDVKDSFASSGAELLLQRRRKARV